MAATPAKIFRDPLYNYVSIDRDRYTSMETHCLKDQVKAKYHQPYFPEKENDQQSARNAIRIQTDQDGKPKEISTIMERLRPVTTRGSADQVRYYVPMEARDAARTLKAQWNP